MSKTISTFKSELQRKLRGTSLSRVADVYSTIGEAAQNVLSEIDPIETVRISEISGGIHKDVYDYTIPTDVKSGSIIDLRPQVKRSLADNPGRRSMQEFDLMKTLEDDKFSIQYDDATRYLRFSKAIGGKQISLDSLDTLTSNGTWAGGDDTTNLTYDTLYKMSGNSSLIFDVSGAGTTAYIENSTLTSVDLSDHENQSTFFLWVYFPDSSIITNVILRWGNDDSNYFSVTQTTPQIGSFKNGWNLIPFSWNGATETGSVTSSAIDYARITITYDGTADTDIRVDSLVSSLGEIWELVYYSKYLFRDTNGVWLEAPTSDNDLINLDTDSYNCLLYEAALLVTQEVGGEDAASDFNFYEAKLFGDGRKPGLYKLYKSSNLSQVEMMQSTYYRL